MLKDGVVLAEIAQVICPLHAPYPPSSCSSRVTSFWQLVELRAESWQLSIPSAKIESRV